MLPGQRAEPRLAIGPSRRGAGLSGGANRCARYDEYAFAAIVGDD